MSFILPQELWEKIQVFFPRKERPNKTVGRPRLSQKELFSGVLFVLKTKTSWKNVPEEYPSGSSLNDYFRYWVKLGVFDKLRASKAISHPELLPIISNWETIEKAKFSTPHCFNKYQERDFQCH